MFRSGARPGCVKAAGDSHGGARAADVRQWIAGIGRARLATAQTERMSPPPEGASTCAENSYRVSAPGRLWDYSV